MRLFVALPLPEPVEDALWELCSGISHARWTLPDQFHLTLRFLGEVSPAQRQDVEEALAAVQVAPFALSLRGVGHFPPRGRARVLWAGVEPSEPLARLQQQVERQLVRVGLAPEPRKYHAHVTLARLDRVSEAQVAEFLATHGLFRQAAWTVDEFCLYSSLLRDDGADHHIESRFALQAT